MHNFELVHHLKKDQADSVSPWKWETCLRVLEFGHTQVGGLKERLGPRHEYYEGQGAYAFCLEVISGVHSPIFGETEVFGQFKNWLKSSAQVGFPSLHVGEMLLADCKKIREEHVTGIAGDSYGSLIRKNLRRCSGVHILGAGQLVEDMLPWLLKGDLKIFVHGRNGDRLKKLQEIFSRLEIRDWSGIQCSEGEALVVAAPVASCDMDRLLGDQRFTEVWDLRGSSSGDPMGDRWGPCKNLQETFALVNGQRAEREALRKRIQSEIRARAEERWMAPALRPQGWEDLCG